jgi:2-keto-3-deoxy-L-rhamnonate aldolase RhmA
MISSFSTRLAELAGRAGFDIVWIEMEHGPVGFEGLETLCLAIEGGGAIPAVRLPNCDRNHVLRALEVGVRILIVPMVNDAATARTLVHHGKFPPLGSRGFSTRSRGVNYGLTELLTSFQQANEHTYLFGQIETMEGIRNLEEICATPGLSGIVIGPGDLSISMGLPGELNDPGLIGVVVDCVKKVRALGQCCGIVAGASPLLGACRR